MRAKHEKTSLKTPGLEQETEEKLAGVFEAQGNKAGEQGETECAQEGFPLDNPRPEFQRDTKSPSRLHPNHKESFSSSFCGGMEQFFQCLTPALLQLR